MRDAASLAACVRHSDTVINLVGRDYETRNFDFAGVHVDGAKAIAKACTENGVGRLIHVSAMNANPKSDSKYLQSKVWRYGLNGV